MKEKKSSDFNALKEFMAENIKGKGIKKWNDARELAKEQFTQSTISILDGSGEVKNYV